MLQVDNAFVQQATGMESHASFALILKFGALQDLHAIVLMETGTVLLVLNVQQIKFGSQSLLLVVALVDKTGTVFLV